MQETRVGGEGIPDEGGAARETAVGHSVIEEPAPTPEPEAAAEAARGPPATPSPPPVTPPTMSSPPTASQEQSSDAPPPGSPAAADRAAVEAAGSDRPELLVAGAFLGAFVFARLLKRLGGSD